MKNIAILKNNIQEYAWGSKTFIPELMGETSPANKPQAELWMGAHPKAPSLITYPDRDVSLLELIQHDPNGILGPLAKKFSNRLPFLFKILAASKPLSIQAHPNKIQAERGFTKENNMNIPMGAPHRNYRDNNHKPELICALESFIALKGFRKIPEIIELIGRIGSQIPELKFDILYDLPTPEGLKNFFYHLLTIPKELQQDIIYQILKNIEQQSLDSEQSFKWVVRLNREYPDDIGILSPLLLNLVHLEPKEAMYIASGELHAYLQGAGLELMANSDNVLRGGLTFKHIDTDELCNILTFNESPVNLLKPKIHDKGEGFYETPTPEFILSTITIQKGQLYQSAVNRGVEVLICIEGDSQIKNLDKDDVLTLSKGVSMIIPAAVRQYQIEGTATIYKAGVPL